MVNGGMYDKWEEYVLIPDQQKRMNFLLNEFPTLLYSELILVDDLLVRSFVRGLVTASKKCGQNEAGVSELVKRYFNQRKIV